MPGDNYSCARVWPPQGTRHARTLLMGGWRVRSSGTSAVARPETVSRGVGARVLSVLSRTATPAGHHGGKSISVVVVSAPSLIRAARPRPPSARGTSALSSSTACPAACQSRAGFHAPKLKPKQTGVSNCAATGSACDCAGLATERPSASTSALLTRRRLNSLFSWCSSGRALPEDHVRA